MATRLVGSRIKRREDPRLITGRGTYVDDIQLEESAWVTYVRSTAAHARIFSRLVSSATPAAMAIINNR